MGQPYYSLDDTTLHSDFPELASQLRQTISPVALNNAVKVARELSGNAPLSDEDSTASHTQDLKREMTLEDKIQEQYDLKALKSQTLVSADAVEDVKKLQSLIRTLPNTPEGEVYAKLARDLEKKAEEEAVRQAKQKEEDAARIQAVMASTFSLGLFDGLGGKPKPHTKDFHPPMKEPEETKTVAVVYHPGLGEAPFRTPLDHADGYVKVQEHSKPASIDPSPEGESKQMTPQDFALAMARQKKMHAGGMQITHS